MNNRHSALIVIDIQNDFCSNGALAVPDGEMIIPKVNKLAERFDTVVQTQDWHPVDHFSFASQQDSEPYDIIEADYGEQILWPDHCVQGTAGARFHPELDTIHSQLIIRKGFRRSIDSYSAFYENDGVTETGLSGYLKNREISDIYLCGLAADFCVKWSALDGCREGFDVNLVRDAVKGIDVDGSMDSAIENLNQAGVTWTSSELLTGK